MRNNDNSYFCSCTKHLLLGWYFSSYRFFLHELILLSSAEPSMDLYSKSQQYLKVTLSVIRDSRKCTLSMPHNPESPFGKNSQTENDVQGEFGSIFADFAQFDTPARRRPYCLNSNDPHPRPCCRTGNLYEVTNLCKVKQCLERYGVEVTVTEGSGNLVAHHQICRIWGGKEFEEDRQDPYEILENLKCGKKIQRKSPSNGSATSTSQSRERRKETVS